MSASDLRKAALRLTQGGGGFNPLKPAETVGRRPGAIATGRPSAAGQGGATALVETDYDARTYWPKVEYTSSDGIFTIEVEPIRRIELEDGRSIEFKEPT